MNGYIRNKTATWVHAMKRNIGPNARVPLTALYEQYGEKHDLPAGPEFVAWLRNVKLRDKDQWEIVFVEDGEELEEQLEEVENVEEKEEAAVAANTVKLPTVGELKGEKIDIHNMTVQDVVNLTVRPAREIVPLIMDVNLLKYALQEANQLAGKDSLCQIIRKRLNTMSLLG